MPSLFKVVPVMAGILLAGSGVQTAQAQALDPAVAGVQESTASSCVADALGAVLDGEACLAAVASAIGLAATLTPDLQGQIGIVIGDVIENFPALRDAILAMVLNAGLPALSAGVQVGLADPGVTNPQSFSPA